MKKKLIMLLLAGVFALTACTSQKKLESDDDFSVESEEPSTGDDLSMDTPSDSGGTDDLSLDDVDSGNAEAKPSDNAAAPAETQDSDLALENELNSLDTPTDNQAANNQQPADELSLDEPAADQSQVAQTPAEGEIPPPSEVSLNDPAQAQAPPADAPVEQVPPADLAATEPPPIVDSAPIVQDNGMAQTPATINTVQYKGNANGGTVAIGADQPLVYTTRFNSTTNQFIVEVQNSSIPKKLKRSLNTKDMASSIGSIDIYQKDGSNVSRFVVQLRAGAPEPIVQPEGNSLLIIGASADGSVVANNTVPTETAPLDAPPPQDLTQAPPSDAPAPDPAGTGDYSAQGDVPKSTYMGSAPGEGGNADREMSPAPATGLLSYESLEEFLMSNTRFYGKKISIETLGMDVTDALKFLSEESGVNIIFDDKVVGAGKVNIKLREVPWDQAFVLILKSKKLAYKRQGNVIRVAAVEDIRAEEDEAIKLKEARKKPDPLVVKRFFIAYAQVDEIKNKVEEYLKTLDSARTVGGGAAPTTSGKVLVDTRNNSLIISDTEKNLKQIEEIIVALDTQPKQILIEAKIVDANESFAKGLGVKWTSNQTGTTGTNSGKITIGGGETGGIDTSGQFTASINWGQIDFLGSLSASLALGEEKNLVKTLSSPRITVLSSQAASINQQTDIKINTTVINPVTGSPSIQETTKQVGLSLSVTPVATNEGTVNLTLNLSRSTAQGVGSQSRSATTQLFVRSGATAVVGGIYEALASDVEEGVPGIRRIPIIGSLFEAKQTERSKNEMMIFVTPTILKAL